jgi:hypothetical protein
MSKLARALLLFTLLASPLAAAYCGWMAAQTADMRFVECHGEYAWSHPNAECRAPTRYGYGILVSLGVGLATLVVLVNARRRRDTARTV